MRAPRFTKRGSSYSMIRLLRGKLLNLTKGTAVQLSVAHVSKQTPLLVDWPIRSQGSLPIWCSGD